MVMKLRLLLLPLLLVSGLGLSACGTTAVRSPTDTTVPPSTVANGGSHVPTPTYGWVQLQIVKSVCLERNEYLAELDNNGGDVITDVWSQSTAPNDELGQTSRFGENYPLGCSSIPNASGDVTGVGVTCDYNSDLVATGYTFGCVTSLGGWEKFTFSFLIPINNEWRAVVTHCTPDQIAFAATHTQQGLLNAKFPITVFVQQSKVDPEWWSVYWGGTLDNSNQLRNYTYTWVLYQGKAIVRSPNAINDPQIQIASDSKVCPDIMQDDVCNGAWTYPTELFNLH